MGKMKSSVGFLRGAGCGAARHLVLAGGRGWRGGLLLPKFESQTKTATPGIPTRKAPPTCIGFLDSASRNGNRTYRRCHRRQRAGSAGVFEPAHHKIIQWVPHKGRHDRAREGTHGFLLCGRRHVAYPRKRREYFLGKVCFSNAQNSLLRGYACCPPPTATATTRRYPSSEFGPH